MRFYNNTIPAIHFRMYNLVNIAETYFYFFKQLTVLWNKNDEPKL